MFAQDRCGRGPHKIKMNPYDAEKHVWIIDDQQHVIWKFTNDGKLVLTLGTMGKRGRDAGLLFDRPTDIDWLPDGTFFISDGYGGTRVAKFDKDGKFLMDWGSAPKDIRTIRARTSGTPSTASPSARIAAVRRGSRAPAVPDLRRERQVPRHVLRPGVELVARTTTTSRPIRYLWVADGGTNRDPQVRPRRPLPVRLGRARSVSPVSSTARTR